MQHVAGSSLYFREQKLNKIKYNRLHDWGFNSTGMFLKNQSDILCRLHCSQKNVVNYMPFILMCLNLLASCCLQQIFQLTLVFCCSGSNIVCCVLSFKYGKCLCTFAGIWFYHTCKLETQTSLNLAHGRHRLPLKGGFLGCAHHAM